MTSILAELSFAFSVMLLVRAGFELIAKIKAPRDR